MPRNSRAKPASNADPPVLGRRAAERFAAGAFAEAADCCRMALARAPRAADLWHLLAAAELACGAAGAARDSVQHCRRLAPAIADYANTEALILERCGARHAAETAWRELLAAHPAHADAWYNLGRLLLATARIAEARAHFEHACALRPDWPDAWKNLAQARFAGGDAAGAEKAFAEALKHAPLDTEAIVNIARLREEADDVEGAMALYQKALAQGVDDATLLRFALITPIFCDLASEIDLHRDRVLANLRALEQRPMRIDDPSLALGNPAFYFAYQGRNDRELQTRLARITARAWRPSAPAPAARRGARPRIAFISAHFKAHTIGRLYAPLIERLPRDGFELALVSIGHHDDGLGRRLAAAADICVTAAEDLASVLSAVHELAPDILFYCDIGMDPWTRYLAGQRLAPVQVTSWGHPVTSGQATMDYFVSSTLIEPADAGGHYSETLVALPAWPVLYDEPAAPDPALGRGDFGFAADERIYLCPQSLFKLHWEFDACLAAILRLDPRGRIVLIESRAPWRARLEARFARHCPDVAARIGFVPQQSTQGFAALLASADVVLDTPHFSGGYTSFETIWAETPFVTTRGAFMRGRVTAGLCDLLELGDAVTASVDEYAERAVSLAAAGHEREAFVAALAARKRRLLVLDDTVLPAYRGFFGHALNVAARARDRVPIPLIHSSETPA